MEALTQYEDIVFQINWQGIECCKINNFLGYPKCWKIFEIGRFEKSVCEYQEVYLNDFDDIDDINPSELISK